MRTLFAEALAEGSQEYAPIAETPLSFSQSPLCSETPEGFSEHSVCFTNNGKEVWTGILRLGFGDVKEKEPYFLLPGFLVGTNRGDAPLAVESHCARLRRGDIHFPASPWWMVRADRLSHPVAMVYGDGHILGLCADPFVEAPSGRQYTGFGCDIDQGCVYYTLGWENAPYFFVDSHHYYKREIGQDQYIALAPGESIRAKLRLIEKDADRITDVHAVVRAVYEMYHQPPRIGETLQNGVKMLSEAVDHDAWMENDQAYAGFVFDRGNHTEFRPLPSSSWTNGMAVAMPQLLSALRLHDEKIRTHALTFIQRLVDGSMNEKSGLPYTSYDASGWNDHGWWYDRQPVPGHAGYLVGQTLYGVLRAYEAEKTLAGVGHPDWLAFVQKALQRAELSCNSDGEYPYIFSPETGAGLCYDSMSGGWCLAAAVYERFLTGRREGLGALLKSEKHYYRHYVERACCYGGPLDIDKNVDSEGVLAYIRALRYLHAITKDDALLSHMKDALYYEFTFKYCMNVPVQIPPLNNGWCSCGGSITSVTNPHIHPMSSSIVDEMLYYLQYRPDDYIESRLRDTVLWGLQTFNRFDGEYGYGKTGWMSERFCYSQGLLTERYPDGSPASTWFALMPWGVGCILEGLCGKWWDREGK